MKVGLVLTQPPTYSETFFLSKIKGLQQKGIDVILFVQKQPSSFTLCLVKVAPPVYKRNIFLQSFFFLIVFIKLIPYIKRVLTFIKLERKSNRSSLQIMKNIYNNAHFLSADLDWLHFGFTTLAVQSENVARSLNAKMAISLRGFDIDIYPLKKPKDYELIWRRVDKVHSISKYLIRKAHHLGLPKVTDYQIITPAIDIADFTIKEKTYNSPIELLTVARLHWIKGLIPTLEALAILKSYGRMFNYTIIGDGQEYGPIVFAIHQLGLKDQVTLTGKLAHDKIVQYYQKANIYIQYSESEGFCNAVLEAQAMGLLCIVSDGGGLIENVLHNETGWIVEKRNPDALAKCIEEVINLPFDRKDMITKNAINRVEDQLSIISQQEQFFKFYE